MYSLKRQVYESMPGWMRAPVRWLPFGLLAGCAYRETVARGNLFDGASKEEIHAYQERMLGEILRFATDQVPAYREYRAVVERLRPFEALKAFPLLDKETLQVDLARYLPRSFADIPHYECTTGGTSGNHLKLYLDDASQSVEMGFMHRQWARVGYRPFMKKATFRGVEFLRRREGEYWQGNPVYNELQFSPFHLNRKTVALYLDKLMEYGPEFLHGYPSAISYLADYVLAASVDVSGMRLKAVLLGSEEVYPEQRAAIEKAFGARAFSWYGHSERVILAGECEKACAYHHFPDYGILEIIGDSGEPVLAEGESGELVGTGLLNRSLPLIRYRTDDRAKRLDCQCVCGRNFERFDNVEGHRKQEFIIGKGGGRMSLASLNIHGPALERVARFQYYQNKIGHMDLRLVVLPGFGEADAAAIKKAFANKLEDELTVRIDVVDDIPLTGRGKLRRLIQEIPAAEMGPTGQ